MRINTACRKSAWLSCLLAAAPAAGQETTQAIVIGQTTTIESQILDETRAISIGTPQFYGDGGDHYGVLYVLDGETNFRQTLASTQFLAGPFTQTLPPLIVVGIGSTDRMRDLTPPSQVQQEIDVYPTQGGADRFLRFILEELEPWVDAHYRTNGYSALLGHSLSGLFALHALVTQPEAFNAYIVLDPSLWWNDRVLLRQTDAFLGSRRGIDASLFLAVSSDEGPDYDTMRGLVERLETKAPNELRWQLTPIVSESHETLPLPGTYQGLRWLFSDWDIEDQASALFSEAPRTFSALSTRSIAGTARRSASSATRRTPCSSRC